MNLGEMVTACRLHLREPTRFDPAAWRILLNAAQMEMQNQTHLLRGDFDITLAASQRLYDIRAIGLYRLLEGGKLIEDNEVIPRVKRAGLASYDMMEEGAPQYLYMDETGVVGLWPVPDATYAGKTLRLHGNYFPAEITAATPDAFVPEWEFGDHPTLVLGAVLQAERIDTDVDISQMVKQQYADGIASMRGRTNNRMGNIGIVAPRYRR